LGKYLVLVGLIFIAAGLIWIAADRLGISLGRLPGDIVIERENFRLYLPIMTSLIISVVLSVILWLFGR
jgi:hypothetical protein